MPIEIRELIIKASIKKEIGNSDQYRSSFNHAEIQNLKREIIDECLEKCSSLIEKEKGR